MLLPARNRKDLEDIPASVRATVEFHFVERVDELIRHALAPMPEIVRELKETVEV